MAFSEVSVYPAYPDKVVIQWSLTDTTLPGDYRFYVERSGSPEGPWVKLTLTPLHNTFLFVDQTVSLIVKENRYYYRILFIDPKGREFTSSSHDLLRNLEKQDYLKAREINRKEGLRLQKKVGMNGFLLKKKHFGPRCTSCIDPATDKVINANCRSCYGTKFKGGYFPAIPICVEIEPFSQVHRLEAGGHHTTENFITRGRMQVYPLATRADLIIELENNRRWEIMGIYRDEIRGVPVTQRLDDIRLISPTDIEYDIPVVEATEAVILNVGV